MFRTAYSMEDFTVNQLPTFIHNDFISQFMFYKLVCDN